MPNFQDSFLSGSNIDFIEGLYARFLEDPTSVDPSWRELFEQSRGQGKPIVSGRNGNGNGHILGNGHALVPPAVSAKGPAPYTQAAVVNVPQAVSALSMGLQAEVGRTIFAF